MSAQLPPTAGRHSKETGGDGGSRGPSRLQTIAWIAATGVLLAGGGLALLTHHPHQPGRPAAGCGLVSCSATIPVTQPPAPVRPPSPSPSASTRPSVTRANFPPRAAASARASHQPSPTLRPTAPASIAGFFNNVGITSNASTGAGNLDGSGYTLSQQALAAAGGTPGSVIRHGSVSFTWPAVPTGQADNIVASGQTIPVSGSGPVLALLVTATWGPARGTGTIRYTDGTSQSFTLTAPDWFQPPPPGSVPLITMGYRNGPGNSQDASHLVEVYYAGVPLAPGK
ncbi:MAG: hypothetical protein ACHP9Z_33260, partial [Streptosporangiales bacterium]